MESLVQKLQANETSLVKARETVSSLQQEVKHLQEQNRDLQQQLQLAQSSSVSIPEQQKRPPAQVWFWRGLRISCI
jgi:FtsZ-binding cell division protein ZapB